MKLALVALLAIMVSGCGTSPGGVLEKVKYDFGIGERPEGYVSPGDQVVARLQKVGETELKRLNIAGRHGEVKYQKTDDLHGLYYKETKVYENAYPLEAKATSGGPTNDRGYVGYIEYTFRIYQSERKPNKTEAAALPVTIATDETGRETYRYTFGPGGTWDGAEGEKVKR